MTRFTVDTHLFRELGTLLVGRDSTALAELVKNSYDADATEVTVSGLNVTKRNGTIVVTDNGNGMTPEIFEIGFLRVASRIKETSKRRSPRFDRRFTGAKGIGRLAAHKLARVIDVLSTPNSDVLAGSGVHGTIDWDEVETHETLDDVGTAVVVEPLVRPSTPGTSITLRGLRKPWTDTALATFVAELQGFDPPELFTGSVPETVLAAPLLFDRATIRDHGKKDPGFALHLDGDFDIGDNYWQDLAERAQWVLEIAADSESRTVSYAVSPTRRTATELDAYESRWSRPHPAPKVGPFFQARIFIRDTGRFPDDQALRRFMRTARGVRVYMEGFRVLPYGERGDDWLQLDADYTRRREPFPLEGLTSLVGDSAEVEGETFFRLTNENYYGAVFLTERQAPELQMLVNREGFVPDDSFRTLAGLVRTGIDLSVRTRAAAAEGRKAARFPNPRREPVGSIDDNLANAQADLDELSKSSSLAPELRSRLKKAASNIGSARRGVSNVVSETVQLRTLAGIGAQFAAFVHETNALLAQARVLLQEMERLRGKEMGSYSDRQRTAISLLARAGQEHLETVERHVAYLTEFVGLNARRRRQRLMVIEALDAAVRLVAAPMARRRQTLVRSIPDDLTTRPMFPSELATVFVNLLTNATKAAGEGGTIRVSAESRDGALVLTVENSGERVNLADGERWFRPFESTSIDVDEVLGQGMGLGLPIVRRIADEYGGRVAFVEPGPKFATAIEFELPMGKR